MNITGLALDGARLWGLIEAQPPAYRASLSVVIGSPTFGVEPSLYVVAHACCAIACVDVQGLSAADVRRAIAHATSGALEAARDNHDRELGSCQECQATA